MNKINFNEFASEAQYEAVMKIVKDEIDEMCDTLMVWYNEDNNIIEIFVDDFVVFVNDEGIYSVEYQKKTKYISDYEIEVFRRIDRIATDMFDVLNI